MPESLKDRLIGLETKKGFAELIGEAITGNMQNS